jgi:L-fuconolactonase
VVGWLDLSAKNIDERLHYFSSYDQLKGFRHIIQAEPAKDFILRLDFCRGISKLREFGFTYDILVVPEHLPYVLKFIRQFPDQLFVIDHLAKPFILKGEIEEWRNDLEKIAAFQNVYCKLSGMVTEADLTRWKHVDFSPYINTVIEAFGVDRVMFGSDWPVCLLGASYNQCCSILEENTQHLNQEDKERLWGQNAATFYKLSV